MQTNPQTSFILLQPTICVVYVGLFIARGNLR